MDLALAPRGSTRNHSRVENRVAGGVSPGLAIATENSVLAEVQVESGLRTNREEVARETEP